MVPYPAPGRGRAGPPATGAISRRTLLKASAALAAFALGACEEHSLAGHATTAKLGIWPGPLSGESPGQRRTRLEQQLGRRFAVDRARGNAYALDKPLVPEYIKETVAQGRQAYLKLQSWIGDPPFRRAVPWADVAAGTWDETLRRRARGAASLPGRHYIAFQAEANLEGSIAQPTDGTPEEFATAFDHTRTVFEREGATNLSWVVVLTAGAYRNGYASLWMPDGFDLIGVDGYNRMGTGQHHVDRSFFELFEPAANHARDLGRRMFIGEMGAQERPGVPLHKARWIAGVPGALQDFGNVEVVVWNHSDDGDGWILDSSVAALEAFVGVANGGRFA